jgi:predicted ATPase/DNA-binding CsgD family transcriptional regulator
MLISDQAWHLDGTIEADVGGRMRRTAEPLCGYPRRLGRLPQPPRRLIGRAREAAAVRRLLADDARMVTLTGPAGVGKTRLAVAAVEGLTERYPGGVYFVDLTAISDPSLVVPAIAQALDLDLAGRDVLLDDLVGRLGDRPTLLVLDNFEQVLPAGAMLARLLATGPPLTLLVTSREPLRLHAEHVFLVPPLQLPDPARASDVVRLAEIESVALFVAQARAVRHDFLLTQNNAVAVAELCVRLDGLPLALELAAARLSVLTPAEVLARLESRLALLRWDAQDAPIRHHALRSAIGWSYDFLSADEQAVFRRLGVFSGGCQLAAALQVAAPGGIDEPIMLELLSSLVEKNMVVVTRLSDRESRFGLLESMRDYARDQLAAAGELEDTRRRHADTFLALAEQAEQELLGPNQARWFERLEREHGNLRAALEWAAEQSNGTVLLRLASSVWRFWWMCGYLRDGERWLEQAMFAAEPAASLRARALDGYGTIMQGLGDYERARVQLEAALDLARAAQDRATAASALVHLGMGAQSQGDEARAATMLEAGLGVYRELGHAWGTALALRSLGSLRRQQGDLDAAERDLSEAIALFRQVGDVRALALALISLASLFGSQGERARAQTLLAEAISLGRKLGDNARIIAACADVVAALDSPWAAPEHAVQLLAAADGLRQRSGIGRSAREQTARAQRVAALRERLGEPDFAACWAAGAGLSINEFVNVILGARMADAPLPPPDDAPASRRRRGTVLSPRELEVLALVAEGQTSYQIATALTITERTVKFHVASVQQKLGTSTRAQAVAVASQRGLL